jgi:biotin transport system permease protein
LIGGYIPGVSWLHRLPAGWKIGFLALLTTITFNLQDLLVCTVAFLLVCAAYFSIGASPWSRLRSFGALWSIFAFMAFFQFISSGPEHALLTLVRMLTILLCADLVTGTTSMLSMIDVFLDVLRPLQKIGLRLLPFSLALTLVLRFVPVQLNDWSRRHEAWRARGAQRSSWILIPIWMADLLKYSDRVAEALDARGFNSQDKTGHAKS